MIVELRKKLAAPQGPMLLDVKLELPAGAFAVLTGPSGSGKSMLLRLLAGLERPEEGRIALGDSVWQDSRQGLFLKPQDRSVGMVFQQYALFPHWSVRQNLRYALPRGESASRIEELLDVMELGELGDRLPHLLSGGQQQRVALARALVRRPKLLLLDEPLSALDVRTRRRLQQYLLQLHRSYGLTILLVTHDPQEMMQLADQLIWLEAGRIVQQGDPQRILKIYLDTDTSF